MSKESDKAASKGARKARKGDGWKSNLVTIGGALLLALFIRVTLFEAFAIDGPSMEPSLLDGDRVVVVTEAGRLEVSATLASLPPGNLAMYYPEANVLVPTTSDAKSGTPAE